VTQKTDWFKNAKWGVFVHFLADQASASMPTRLTVDEWNQRVDAFDVDGLARQLSSVGAGYLGITTGQRSGFYCTPNAAYDRITGIVPSRCSRRDLIADLARALRAYNIPILAYVTSAAPGNDLAASTAFGCPPRKQGPKGAPENESRLADFQVKWEAVLREWSLHWGENVAAWWVDGVYYPDSMYRHEDAPNFASFLAAMRAGNPDALVALNPGIRRDQSCVKGINGSGGDFTTGEVDFWLPVPGRYYNGGAAWPGRFVDGEQFQVFTFLGPWWGMGDAPRFPDNLTAGYTELVNAHEGVITWDVPVDERGLLPASFMNTLRKLPRRC
jgi:hypothetical protein